jgi:hypothetical protein
LNSLILSLKGAEFVIKVSFLVVCLRKCGHFVVPLRAETDYVYDEAPRFSSFDVLCTLRDASAHGAADKDRQLQPLRWW